MESDLSSSIAEVRAAVVGVEALASAGCLVTDGLLACGVAIPATRSNGVPHKSLLDQLRDLSDIHLSFEQGSLSFELTATSGSPLDFLHEPAGDPESVFDASTLPVAKRAWQGDAEAAATLPGIWRGDVSVRLHSPFDAQNPDGAWRVVRTVRVILDAFTSYPWWRSSELIRAGSRPVLVVVTND